MKKFYCLYLGLIVASVIYSQGMLESRIDSLLSKMTTAEKIEQLYNNSFMTTPDNLRLNIPGFIMDDGPHGVRFQIATAFPTGIAMASTWDINYLEQLGKAMGREFHAFGKHQQLGPCIDLARDPRAGRTAESAGEDPFLSGHVGASLSKGIQSTPVIATIKHFMGESKQSYRNTCNEIISERNLMDHNGYNFRYAMQESGAMSFMSSYNLINGNKAAESEQSLKQNLRKYWGFPFYVVSDWGAVWDTKKAIIAGTEICMGSDHYKNDLPALVSNGTVSMSVINEAVRRVLRTKILNGMLDYYPAGNKSDANSPENVKIALDGARKSIILLKNENNILPLSKDIKTVAIIGPNAKKGNLNCFGSSETTPPYSVSLKQGLENKIGMSKIIYSLGCNMNDTDTSKFEEAIAIANGADVVIFAGGLDETQEGEAYDIGNDRKNNSSALPGKQLDLINKLAKVNPNIIVVLQSGGVCSINKSITSIKGLIYSFYAGQEAGNAIADVLFGDYNPAGRMPVTMPKTDSQLPPWDDDYNNDYGCGYRWFDEKGYVPEFAFGFGLSYTSFSYSNIIIAPSVAEVGSPVTINVDIENTGSQDGEEVAQLYITDIASGLYMPKKELKGFQRVAIKAGEKKTISFNLNAEDFYYWDETNKRYTIDPGEYSIKVGGSSDNLPLSGTLNFSSGLGKPDLKITALYTMPRFPLQTQKVSFYSLVKNLGNAPLVPGDYKIEYSINDTGIVASSKHINDTIFPGQVYLIASDSSWTAQHSGIISIKAAFDPDNIANEWIEDNNSYDMKLEVFSKDSDPSTDNFAYKKKVVVSSQESDILNGDLMVDGNQNTRWASGFYDNQYAVIDMGQEQTFNTIKINWEDAFAKEYNVLVSSDSITWDTIGKITNGTAGMNTLNVPKTGRYIKIDCSKRGSIYGFSIWEIKVNNGTSQEINNAPVANAGNDKIIILPENSVDISASQSSDPENDQLTFNWWQLNGPSQVVITNEKTVNATVSDLVEGKYCFVVTVSDNQASSSDLVYVTVKSSVTDLKYETKNDLKVFPNPFIDLVNIILPENTYHSISIIDIMGKTISIISISESDTHITLDLSFLTSGLYFIKVSGYNVIHPFKVDKR